ncbi:MAG TPA: hypothetical protein VFL97_00305 [Nitrococcus sp.]|nr:hypothetical protein [Nitrococcus sp.]
MSNCRHFQAWLRLARSLDWSFEQRDASCVRAFTALQLAVEKCGRSGHKQEPVTNKNDLNDSSAHCTS